jgi:hypothetical protein
MAIDPLKAEVAMIVCSHFTRSRAGTGRRELILSVKDGQIIYQMVQYSLLRAEGGENLYFPTLGTFALLQDDHPNFVVAKRATIQVIELLRRLYAMDAPIHNLNRSQLFAAAEKMFGIVIPDVFDLGLYLVDFSGLNAIQGYSRDTDLITFKNLTVSERIMMVDDPEAGWQRCVDTCRRNAQPVRAELSPASIQTQERTPKVRMGDREQTSKGKAWLPNGWELVKPIGEGGQGWTYTVRRKSDQEGNYFVFKRLKNGDRADRFRDEIKALRTLEHPGILRIEDDGTIEDKPYYIAEYCENGDLSKRNLAALSALEKLLLFRQICLALAAAHNANVVHRDIKPSNILVRADGTIAVGDFGLCLHLGAEERLTRTEEAVGAQNYIAPELEGGRREDVNPAADVYSLGKLLYFLFAGRSIPRERHREQMFDLTNPAKGEPENGICFVYELLDKCIVEDPESRFKDGAELLTAVEGVIRRLTLNAHVLDLSVRQPCLFCVEGDYRPFGGNQPSHDGIALVCWKCGNMQRFNAPHTGWRAWWIKQ